MRKVFLIIVLLVSSISHSRAMTKMEMEQQLLSIQVLRAQYQQTRHAAGLEASLESSGRLVLAREVGLAWVQTEPFSAEFVFTDEAVFETFPGKSKKVRLRSEHAEIFKIVSMITTFLEGDTSFLEKTFTMAFTEETDNRWSLVLTPRIGRIKKLFASITLKGNMFIESMEINETGGNRSIIEFFDQATTPTTLSIDESHYFQN